MMDRSPLHQLVQAGLAAAAAQRARTAASSQHRRSTASLVALKGRGTSQAEPYLGKRSRLSPARAYFMLGFPSNRGGFI